jgi:hypothetical protein
MTILLDLLLVRVDSNRLHHALLRCDVHCDGDSGFAACMC